MSADLRELARRVLAGERAAVAQALNLIEDRRPEARAAATVLLEVIGAAPLPDPGHRIGLTGPPGVGKSTLAAALTRLWRAQGRTVGVVAIDPSSVRSGGALLGDRVRMAFDPADDGIFLRSIATAGEPGGLSRSVPAAVRVLGAAYRAVLIETTGVGQTETDVEHVADTVVLVVQPGSGDVLQFLKAGIMEIPDLLVVNKADMGAPARRAASDLRAALDVATVAGAGHPVPIVIVSARDGTGVEELAESIDAHARVLDIPGIRARRRAGDIAWALGLFARAHGEHGIETLGGREILREDVESACSRGQSPLAIAAALGDAYLEAIRVTAGGERRELH
jgi:LAO/AO transport system kinase